MNQLVMLGVSEKSTRLDAEAQVAPLDALGPSGEAAAEEECLEPNELVENLLDRAGNEEPRVGRRDACAGGAAERRNGPVALGFGG